MSTIGTKLSIPSRGDVAVLQPDLRHVGGEVPGQARLSLQLPRPTQQDKVPTHSQVNISLQMTCHIHLHTVYI